MYSKSEYTIESVSVSGRPSVRPSVYTITLENYMHVNPKLSPQYCLIDISVEFEDEKDRPRNSWVILKILKNHQTTPEEGYIDLKKKIFSQNYLKYIWIDATFNADSESDISSTERRIIWKK